VDAALRRAGVVVVMNRDHVKKPEDLVTTMWEVYQAGYVAECTFRIDAAIIREAMQELTRLRAKAPAENPFILGVGSVINPFEFDEALALGFDMIVAPADIEAGYDDTWETVVQRARARGVFLAPAAATPTELSYFLERDDGLEPNAVKIFPADSAEHVGAILAPYRRERHRGKIIMPTGGVNAETGPKFQKIIMEHGFAPVLGMSAPLARVSKEGKPGDVDCIRRSLEEFRAAFKPYMP
jgi:2-keto-3-deoxy-6-phosphogluconate aldolase